MAFTRSEKQTLIVVVLAWAIVFLCGVYFMYDIAHRHEQEGTERDYMKLSNQNKQDMESEMLRGEDKFLSGLPGRDDRSARDAAFEADKKRLLNAEENRRLHEQRMDAKRRASATKGGRRAVEAFGAGGGFGGLRSLISPAKKRSLGSLPPVALPGYEKRSRGDLIWSARIFISLAAFRDKFCHVTVLESLMQAANPERLSFGILQQSDPIEEPEHDCHQFQALCTALTDAFPGIDADHATVPAEFEQWQVPPNAFEGTVRSPEDVLTLCRALKNRFKLEIIHYKDAEGPCPTRAVSQAMLADEDFVLGVDSHTEFIGGWDVALMGQWTLTERPERSVLTVYPKDNTNIQPIQQHRPNERPADQVCGAQPVDPSARLKGNELGYRAVTFIASDDPALEWYPYDPNFACLPPWTPIICHSAFLEDDMPKFNGANPMHPRRVNDTVPLPHPFWAAGFNFAPRAAVLDAPYDPHLRFVFDGEEYSTGARLYTRGYDLYAPFFDVVFHRYAHSMTAPKYWQIDWNKRKPIQLRAQQRIRLMLGLPLTNATEAEGPNMEEFDKYTVGTTRSIEEYFLYSGMNFKTKYSESLCADAAEGRYPYNRGLRRYPGVPPNALPEKQHGAGLTPAAAWLIGNYSDVLKMPVGAAQ